MRKILFIALVLGMALSFNACAPGYVAVVPTYRDGPKPPSPSNKYVWRAGNWEWDRRTSTYIHRDGVWVKSKNGRNLKEGYWKKSKKGHYWVRGK